MRKVSFALPYVGEEEAAAARSVLLSGWLTHGPKTEEFEKRFCNVQGTPHAVAVSSCTAALHLGLQAHGIGPGDEVIVPAQTHVATAHTVEFTGARPVFADVDPATANVTVDTISRVLSPKTRAVQIVHFAGLPCDMDGIAALCRSKGLLLFEDCAHTVGVTCRGRSLGTFGAGGSFSFYPIKHMTTSEGGMFICANAEVAAKVRSLRAFGIDTPPHERKRPGVYDVTCLGNNYRMTEVEAAIGLVQLGKLPDMLARRRHCAQLYDQGLHECEQLVRPPIAGDRAHAFFVYNILVRPGTGVDRDTLMRHLNGQQIGTSIYYATPVPFMTYYRRKYGFRKGDFPGAEQVADTSIALPMGPHLSTDDVEYVIETLKKGLTGAR